MDMIHPPSTVEAAYNHLEGERDMRICEFNEHEGGANNANARKDARFISVMALMHTFALIVANATLVSILTHMKTSKRSG
jgi:hypothetical protein